MCFCLPCRQEAICLFNHLGYLVSNTYSTPVCLTLQLTTRCIYKLSIPTPGSYESQSSLFKNAFAFAIWIWTLHFWEVLMHLEQTLEMHHSIGLRWIELSMVPFDVDYKAILLYILYILLLHFSKLLTRSLSIINDVGHLMSLCPFCVSKPDQLPVQNESSFCSTLP